MSRRSVPNIDPNALRDHASTDRVDRIWSRIEADLEAQSLVGDETPTTTLGSDGRSLRSTRPALFLGVSTARRRVWVALAAAAVFGGGIFVGRTFSHDSADRVASVGSTRDTAIDVFASGSESRTFQLPNGGSILLEPESTLEVSEIGETSMTLRLLRGSASVDNTRAAAGSVAIVAGEARLSAPAGGIVAVRRNERDVDVIVSGGNVDLDAPGVHQHLSNGDRLHAVPISWPTAVLDPAKHHTEVDAPLPPMHVLHVARDGRPDHSTSDQPQVTATQPSWYSEYSVGHDEAALKLLEQQGDMKSIIMNAQSGAELAALSDLNGGKNQTLWLLAAKRAVDEFPQSPKVVGFAFQLSSYYEKHNEPELAAKYGALAGDRFRDDMDCRALRRGDPASAETAERARAYLTKYPTGSCRADAESLAGDDPQKIDPHAAASSDDSQGGPKPDGSSNPDAGKTNGSKQPPAPSPTGSASSGPSVGAPGAAGSGEQKHAANPEKNDKSVKPADKADNRPEK